MSKPETKQLPVSTDRSLDQSISRAQKLLLSHRHPDGFWWYTLEANDSINAEFILLLKYLNIDDPETVKGLCQWLLSNQNKDGSWSLYHGGPGDISSTVECYTALKMSGHDPKSVPLKKARKFILDLGGMSKIRIFSRVHLALFSLVSWKTCPNMPVALIQFPEWAPLNIYEFSSWARACIVPLLVIMDQKKSITISNFNLDELYPNNDPSRAKWTFDVETGPLSFENAFVQIDRALKIADRLKVKPLRKLSLAKCEKYIREHLTETEDIFPAMFYGLIALNNLGYPQSDVHCAKALLGLRSFHVITSHNRLTHLPSRDSTSIDYNVVEKDAADSVHSVYQQCCISPVWDTAWAGVALLDSGVRGNHPKLIETARWLMAKQITDTRGDWAVKNPNAAPGGWSFEFNNKHYPDIDDTIEVLTFLHQIDLPYRELQRAITRGVDWILSMQCRNGGFAAFDKDNDLDILNKLPFSDHGACLDPATVDITGRLISFLINTCAYEKSNSIIQRAADFIVADQESNGSFWGRWGVNYIYGTWCALEGLCALNRDQDELIIQRAVHWLKSVQNKDGGFGESCESYAAGKYVSLDESTPSQTAWALMALINAGLGASPQAKKAAEFLMSAQNKHGGWDEEAYTGTGFPGHFYIRYHGYRYYFPLMALARYSTHIVGVS